MTSPLLSICIPTYNRAHYLRDALDSILLQLTQKEGLMDLVEVVVMDNDSTDTTEELVNGYHSKIKQLAYKKQAHNVGFDGNVNAVVRASTGLYCWYLGDDDMIINGALSYIVTICRSNQYNVISVADRPLKNRAVDSTVESYSDKNHVVSTTPSESYLNGHLPSALSLLIFRRKDWINVADFADHTPGWFYFETILKIAIQPSAQVLYINKPMIVTGQDMRWSDGGAGLKIFIDCNNFLHKMLTWGYDRKMTEHDLHTNARRFPIVLLQAKGKGLPMTLHNLKLVRSYTATTPITTQLVSHILFFIPNPVVRLVRDLRKKIRR
jgi:glycosyltransferase involved in cell wall biosynthesis